LDVTSDFASLALRITYLWWSSQSLRGWSLS